MQVLCFALQLSRLCLGGRNHGAVAPRSAPQAQLCEVPWASWIRMSTSGPGRKRSLFQIYFLFLFS